MKQVYAFDPMRIIDDANPKPIFISRRLKVNRPESLILIINSNLLLVCQIRGLLKT